MYKVWDLSCISCNHTFEELIETNEPDPSCPICNSPTTKLLPIPTNTHDVRMSTLMSKGRDSYNRMKSKSANDRGR